MNIGITVSLSKENESLWINGIKLNALYLLKALKETGHNVYLLNQSVVTAPYENKVAWDTKEFPIHTYTDMYKETDLMIWLGATYGDNDILDFKKTGSNKKVIKYVCGNNYMNDLEASMFTSKSVTFPESIGYNQEIDEVWYVPQQEEMNREYYRVLHNLPASKVRPVPFIWDPIFLDQESARYHNPEVLERNLPLPVYKPGKPNKEKQLACFEPNIGGQKWHINSLLIAEDYLNAGGTFDKLNILCGERLLEDKYYTSIIKHTKIFNIDPIKLIYLPRMQAVDALAQFTDIVVAHQIGNPLNYSYLDALYLQFPLVHNAPMLKDAGYYYQGNSIGSGARQLKLAIEKHDDMVKWYNQRSENVLTRYTVFNEGLIETYSKLIENTMGIKDHKISSNYDWQTNLYK